MPRFFVSSESIKDNTVILTGDDAFHISRSLRMAQGEEITVCDDSGCVYSGILTAFTKDSVTVSLSSPMCGESELPCEVHLYQAFPKGDKWETIIMKAVELGATTITPFLSERCVKRPHADKTDALLLRWNRIAEEAAKQCGRARLPVVRTPHSFREALAEATDGKTALFCYENETACSIKKALSSCTPRKISLIVGSEGGFSPKESQEAISAGCIAVGLGPRILRCETAPLYALACISYHFEL